MLNKKIESLTQETVEILKNEVNWQQVADLTSRMGSLYDTPAYRFIKGDRITRGIQVASNDRFTYVDEEGYDNVDSLTGLKFEIRSLKKDLYLAPRSWDKIGFIRKGLIFKNPNGNNQDPEKLEKTFDYFVGIQSDPKHFCVWISPWEIVITKAHFKGAAFKLTAFARDEVWEIIEYENPLVSTCTPVKDDNYSFKDTCRLMFGEIWEEEYNERYG